MSDEQWEAQIAKTRPYIRAAWDAGRARRVLARVERTKSRRVALRTEVLVVQVAMIVIVGLAICRNMEWFGLGRKKEVESPVSMDSLRGSPEEPGSPSGHVTLASVSKLSGEIQSIAKGNHHTCVLVNSGVSCWGSNTHGQLSDRSTVDLSDPALVSGLFSSVQVFTAGGVNEGRMRELVETSRSAIFTHTQTGDLRFDDLVPRQKLLDISRFMGEQIPPPGGHTCAIVNGEAWCWEFGSHGQLGDLSAVDRYEPSSVSGFSSSVQAITAGNAQTRTIMNGSVEFEASWAPDAPVLDTPRVRFAPVKGSVRYWGSNAHGQLGDRSAVDHPEPTLVSGLSSGVQAIAAGEDHACVIVKGSVWCWGSNAHGRLGDRSAVDHSEPTLVSGLSSGVQAIAAGKDHTCAIVNGSVRCWGSNAHGQLGDRSTLYSRTPVQIPNVTGARAIMADGDKTCALVKDGVQCWGDDT